MITDATQRIPTVMTRTGTISLALITCCFIACGTVEHVCDALVRGQKDCLRIECEARARSIAEQLRLQIQAMMTDDSGPSMQPPHDSAE